MDPPYVESWMIRDVVTIQPEASIYTAVCKLLERNVGSLVVIDAHEVPEGILTKRNILDHIKSGKDPKKTLVRDAMANELIVVTDKTLLKDALTKIVAHRIKRLPVVELTNPDHPKLVGILTSTVIMKQLSRLNNLKALRRVVLGDIVGELE